MKVQLDNGGEYCSKEFKSFCVNKGITLNYNVPYNPEMNILIVMWLKKLERCCCQVD